MATQANIKINLDSKDGEKSIGALNNELIKTTNTIGSLEAEMARLNDEIAEVELGSAEFKRLQTEIKKVDSELKNAGDSISGMSSADKAGEVGKLAGSLGAVAAAGALVGANNKSSEEFFKTFATGLAIMTAVQGAAEGYTAAKKLLNIEELKATGIAVKNNVVKIISVVQTGALAVATGVATAAQWLFNAAVSANPIGLIVIGVAALIGGIVALVSNIDVVIEAFVSFGKAIYEFVTQYLYYMSFGLIDIREKNDEVAESEKKKAKVVKKSTKEQLKDIAKLIKTKGDEIATSEGLVAVEETRFDNLKRQNAIILRDAEAEGKSIEEIKALKIELAYQEYIAGIAAHKRKTNLRILQLQEYKLTQEQMIINAKKSLIDGDIDKEKYDNKLALIKAQFENTIAQFRAETEANKLSLQEQENDYVDYINELNKTDKSAAKSTSEKLKTKEDEFEDHLEELLKLEIAAEEKAEAERDTRILNAQEKEEKAQEAFNNQEIKNKQIILEREEKAEEKARDKRIEDKKQDKEDALTAEKEYQEKLKEMKAEFAAAVYDAAIEIAARKDEADISAIQSQNETTNNLLDEQLAREYGALVDSQKKTRVSKEVADAELQALTDRFNHLKDEADKEASRKETAIKKKAFERNKALSLVEIVISTAKAIAAVSPVVPLMVLAGATGAVQAGMVGSQKFKAARGGIVPGQASSIDSVDAFLAPGEAVINAVSAQAFAPQLSAINQAGGGISLGPTNIQGTNETESVFASNNTNQVIKAVVVETDITKSQNKISRYQRSAEF